MSAVAATFIASTRLARAGSESPDAELIADCRRFEDLERRQRPLVDAGAKDDAVLDRLQPEIDALDAAKLALLERIFAAEAQTIEGIRARVSMIGAYRPFDAGEKLDAPEMMVAALCRDLGMAVTGGRL